MLTENHKMQVFYKEFPKHDKIMLCKVTYSEDVHAKKNHAMENYVRRGIAVIYNVF